MSKRPRDSGGGEDDEGFDPMAFYRQQQQAMLNQAAQHVEESRDEIIRAQVLTEHEHLLPTPPQYLVYQKSEHVLTTLS